MNAYDKFYLEKARSNLGNMLDFAVNHIHLDVRCFWDMFLASKISEKFESGDSTVIAGKSGIELCIEIAGNAVPSEKDFREEKSPEYWAGWALAYYQWESGYSFACIDACVAIENIISMYFPYHEMDIRQFCDRMNEIIQSKQDETNLKRIRKSRGLTQGQLSGETGIPLRTIQQYEQGQKSINGARSEYLIAFAKALYCKPEELLEK